MVRTRINLLVRKSHSKHYSSILNRFLIDNYIVYLALVVVESKKLKKRGHTLFAVEHRGRYVLVKKFYSVAYRLR